MIRTAPLGDDFSPLLLALSIEGRSTRSALA
jgi:hypothetical protein